MPSPARSSSHPEEWSVEKEETYQGEVQQSKVRLEAGEDDNNQVLCFNDADHEHQDTTYETLLGKIRDPPSQNLLIVMGDLNAMGGAINIGNERVLGRHNNSECLSVLLLRDFFHKINLGPLFPHTQDLLELYIQAYAQVPN